MTKRASKPASPVEATTTPEPKKPKRKKPSYPWPFVVAPLNCAILAVDPGQTSGWCIWSRGRIVAHGFIDNIFESPGTVRSVIEWLLELPGPHVFVCERPFRGRGSSATSVGAGGVLWCDRAKAMRVRRVVRVFPSVWRSRVLGKGWGNAKRDHSRAEEQRVAGGLLATCGDTWPFVRPVHPDVAPAVCIGAWASHAGEVVAKLPKPKAPKEPKAKRTRKAAA